MKNKSISSERKTIDLNRAFNNYILLVAAITLYLVPIRSVFSIINEYNNVKILSANNLLIVLVSYILFASNLRLFEHRIINTISNLIYALGIMYSLNSNTISAVSTFNLIISVLVVEFTLKVFSNEKTVNAFGNRYLQNRRSPNLLVNGVLARIFHLLYRKAEIIQKKLNIYSQLRDNIDRFEMSNDILKSCASIQDNINSVNKILLEYSEDVGLHDEIKSGKDAAIEVVAIVSDIEDGIAIDDTIAMHLKSVARSAENSCKNVFVAIVESKIEYFKINDRKMYRVARKVSSKKSL